MLTNGPYTYTTTYPTQQVCPTCGKCPTCGSISQVWGNMGSVTVQNNPLYKPGQVAGDAGDRPPSF